MPSESATGPTSDDGSDATSFADKLLQRSLARKRAASGPPVTPARAECRRSASLLSRFDPRRLHVVGQDELRGTSTLAVLVDDCISLAPRGALQWRLKKDVRQAALSSFASPGEALVYLEANLEQIGDRSSSWFAHELLLGHPQALSTLSIDDLIRLRKAISWLALVPGISGLPDEAAVNEALARARLLDPLKLLLRETFEGRTEELAVVERHLGLVRRGRPTTRARSLPVRRRGRVNYPLVIFGPGGIGKSTLIARSLLDHLENDRIARFPFVYVDAERATVDLDEPTSLVAEMARQLAIQYPVHGNEFSDIAATAGVWSRDLRARREEIADLRGASSTRTLSRDAARSYHSMSREDGAHLITRLGRTLATASGPGAPPFVIALDSFEEAQYRASPVLDRMWAMLHALEEVYPNTRVVVAGRAPIGHPTIEISRVPTLELTDLDPAAARRFLVHRQVDPTLAADVVARVGGNPLNLQLAAKVCVKAANGAGNAELLRSIPARRRRIFGVVDDMLIQGMLYDRVLMHVRDGEVRRLAHPGLVLRRITPEVIEHVLAPVCGVRVDSPSKASELFEELARELDLVDRVAPDVLRHRSDVRKVMLRLLKADRNPEVTAVEEAAVGWYADKSSAADRAEELYHRLRLGRDLKVVVERWRTDLRPHLVDVADELPSRSAKLLTKLLEDAPDALPEQEQVEWEQDAAAEAEDLLAQGFATDALSVIGARRPWTTGSPLHALQAEILARLGQREQARTAVAAALDEDGIEAYADQQLELLLLSAKLAAEAGDWAAADSDLDVAERVALRLGQDLDSLGVLLQRARLLEAAPELAASALDDDARTALLARVRQVPDEVLSSRPALYRAVAGQVGDQEPGVLAHALELVGLPALSATELAELTDAIMESMDEPGISRLLADFANQQLTDWSDPAPAVVRGLLEEVSRSGRLDELAKHLLAAHDRSGALQRGIAAVMQEDLPPVAGMAQPDQPGAWHSDPGATGWRWR